MSTPLDRLRLPAGILSTDSEERLCALLSEEIRGSLLIFNGPSDVALAAAEAFANSLVSSSRARALDVRLAVPEGDKWSISELDTSVIQAASYVAVERTVVVVGYADRMDANASEHLLKTVEEPPANALFIFCVESLDRVLPTIQGRASHTLRLDPADRPQRVAALVSSGWEAPLAEELVDLAGDQMALVASLTALEPAKRDAAVLDLRTLYATSIRTQTPTVTAESIIRAAERLASLEESRKALSPRAKAQVRTLVRSLFRSWRRELSLILREEGTPGGYSFVTVSLQALDQAELELSSYAPPLNVVAAALSRTPAQLG